MLWTSLAGSNRSMMSSCPTTLQVIQELLTPANREALWSTTVPSWDTSPDKTAFNHRYKMTLTRNTEWTRPSRTVNRQAIVLTGNQVTNKGQRKGLSKGQIYFKKAIIIEGYFRLWHLLVMI